MYAQKTTPSSHWSDIHFAYQVALLGTLSAAAEVLDVHHSTVLRRIDALEKRLNTRLFQRHARGYTPTEAGRLLLKVGEETQLSLDTLMGQLAGADEQLTGKIIVTTVESFSQELTAVLADFQARHVEIRIEYIVDARIYRPEYGEAHVCIRPGLPANHPDYIVQHLRCNSASLYASKKYLQKYGPLKSLSDLKGHRFISSLESLDRIPFMSWLETHVPSEQIYYRAADFSSMLEAGKAGIGIVPIISCCAKQHDTLIPVVASKSEWDTDLWLITHRDVHRSAKIQAFTRMIKEYMGK